MASSRRSGTRGRRRVTAPQRLRSRAGVDRGSMPRSGGTGSDRNVLDTGAFSRGERGEHRQNEETIHAKPDRRIDPCCGCAARRTARRSGAEPAVLSQERAGVLPAASSRAWHNASRPRPARPTSASGLRPVARPARAARCSSPERRSDPSPATPPTPIGRVSGRANGFGHARANSSRACPAGKVPSYAASFTYSKSPGLLSMPTRGAAIQLANLPGSVTCFIRLWMKSPSPLDGSQLSFF